MQRWASSSKRTSPGLMPSMLSVMRVEVAILVAGMVVSVAERVVSGTGSVDCVVEWRIVKVVDEGRKYSEVRVVDKGRMGMW